MTQIEIIENGEQNESVPRGGGLDFEVKELVVDLPQGYRLNRDDYNGSAVRPNMVVDPELFVQSVYGEQVDHAEDGSLNMLFDDIKKFPLLTKKLEEIIFTHIGQGHTIAELKADPGFYEAFSHADPEKVDMLLSASSSLAELVMNSNMRLVAKVAQRYKGRLPMSDMIAEGAIGMQRAVAKFEVERGFKFSTYATHWIRQGIVRAISDQGRAIRLPVHALEDLAKVNRIVDEFFLATERYPEFHELVELGVLNNIDKNRMTSIIEAAMSGSARAVSSLDTPVGEDGESTLGDYFAHEQGSEEIFAHVASKLERSAILDAMNILDARERRVLLMRFGFVGREHTLEEVGREFDVTRERIRQIEATALRKLREYNRVRKIRGRELPAATSPVEANGEVKKVEVKTKKAAINIAPTPLEPGREVKVRQNGTAIQKKPYYAQFADFYENSEFIGFEDEN